jgi:glycosyltransferase involved in cell wall biosynthesis
MRAAEGAAIVPDWLVVEGGAERVVLEFAELLPSATLHTTFFDVARFGSRIAPGRVKTWPLQRLFGASRRYRAFLPFYPLYFGAMDLSRYELVVSSSIAFPHAVRTGPRTTHVSYVYTPMRYAWDLDTYLDRSSFSLPTRIASRVLRPALRRWDRATAGRPDVLVAISTTVQERISRIWGRDSEVLYPPVDVEEITPSAQDDGYYLIAARLLAYRRIDLAVAAATRLGRELVVVGDGPERRRLEALAGPTVRFMGHVDRPALVDLIRRCHAYLVPGVEDFGIAPVEAMAAGKPVIAIGAGGAAETVVDGKTGVLFGRPTAEALTEAILASDGMAFDPAVIRARAEEFSAAAFRDNWRALFGRLGVDPSLYFPR